MTWLLLGLGVCGSLACEEEVILDKVPPKGDLHGHTCDAGTGLLVPGAAVSIAAYDHLNNKPYHLPLNTVADATGFWTLREIPAGEQTIAFDLAALGFHAERTATVIAEQDTAVEDPACVIPTGTIVGRICDQRSGLWAGGARVWVEYNSQVYEAYTESDGRFTLPGVPQGTHDVNVRKGDFILVFDDVQVFGDAEATIGHEQCLQPDCGDLRGRICVAGGTATAYWLADARVYVQIGDLIIETTTDLNGWFLLECVPAGLVTVHAERGSFAVEFTATVLADVVTEIIEPQCMDSGNYRVAVVTGVFDSVENLLDDVGFVLKERFDDTHYPTPEVLDTTAQPGNITLIEGRNTSFWADHFLADLDWMSQFNIIFFNCGLADIWFAGTPGAVDNLTAYVESGGSIYVSDWAYELLRLSFPAHLDWIGSEAVYGAAKVGRQNAHQGALVVDRDLAAALGDTTPGDGMEVEINFNDSVWVVQEAQATQEALGAKVWVRGDVNIGSGVPQIVYNSSMMASFAVGQNGGKVIFTSFHNHSQVNDAMAKILKYIIFEL